MKSITLACSQTAAIVSLAALSVLFTPNSSRAAVSNFGDPTTWLPVIYGSGVQVATLDGGTAFQVTYSPGAQPTPPTGGVGVDEMSTFAIGGDFSIQVGYTLNAWPPGNRVDLAVTLGALPYAIGLILSDQGTPTIGLSGRVQVSRVGGVVSTSYWDPTTSAWDPFVVLAYNSTQDFQISFGSASATTLGQTVQFTFDDPVITAQTILPGPYAPFDPSFWQPPWGSTTPPTSAVPDANSLWTDAVALLGLCVAGAVRGRLTRASPARPSGALRLAD